MIEITKSVFASLIFLQFVTLFFAVIAYRGWAQALQGWEAAMKREDALAENEAVLVKKLQNLQ